MTGSYSEILERPLFKQGIVEEEDNENEKTEDAGKEDVSLPWSIFMNFSTMSRKYRLLLFSLIVHPWAASFVVKKGNQLAYLCIAISLLLLQTFFVASELW